MPEPVATQTSAGAALGALLGHFVAGMADAHFPSAAKRKETEKKEREGEIAKGVAKGVEEGLKEERRLRVTEVEEARRAGMEEGRREGRREGREEEGRRWRGRLRGFLADMEHS
ncbi:hypothetical protein CC80DRAFT_551199 [Byssothecium circinans]|uniref:Uncharacterized protein n=1 Tax=Byssothecium circinans TaxID=147558 RepID=A0A6A5TLJ3_9PLEO|nr:hypothetical protein CC80DRAFT_551199 [Byssothecium circinans]